MQRTLDLLIHGIDQVIRAPSGDRFQVEHGSLYPALHRLRRKGWIESEWGLAENNQRVRFYR